MPNTQYSRHDVADRGQAIYEQDIRPRLAAEKIGQYVVLDIESGQFEIDEDDLIATQWLISKCPRAVIYGVRIGFPAAYRLGGLAELQAND